jgi:hypothetical protein
VILDDVPLNERIFLLHISFPKSKQQLTGSLMLRKLMMLVPPQSRYGNDELACTVASVSTIYHDQTVGITLMPLLELVVATRQSKYPFDVVET